MTKYISGLLVAITIVTTATIVYIIYKIPDADGFLKKIADKDCKADDKFIIAYKNDKNSVKENKDGFSMLGNSVINRKVCHDGVLSITAYGQKGANNFPKMIISSDSTIISDFSIGKEVEINLPIKGPTVISVAYLNDYYRILSRSIHLSKIRFIGKECDGIEVESLSESMGSWFPDKKDLVLINEGTVKFKTCSSGIMEANYNSESPDSNMPRLQRISADGNTPITDSDGKIRVNVACCSLYIAAINTRIYRIDDSNLFIKKISWSKNVK